MNKQNKKELVDRSALQEYRAQVDGEYEVHGGYPAEFLAQLADQAMMCLGERLAAQGMELEVQALNGLVFLGVTAMKIKNGGPDALGTVEKQLVMETTPALMREMKEMGYEWRLG